MKRILQIFYLLMSVSVCLAYRSLVNFDAAKENGRRFPWMVTIAKDTSLRAYGALIHPRAVLTLAFMQPKISLKFDFKVYAGCYFKNFNYNLPDSWRCKQSREVKEYHIIEKNEKNYTENLAILVLVNRFDLHGRVNIIPFTEDVDAYFNVANCTVLALRNLENSETHKKDRYFVASSMVLDNKQNFTGVFALSSDFEALDDRDRKESFIEYPVGYETNFYGSPFLCQVWEPIGPWRLLGMANFSIRRGLEYIEVKKNGHLIKIDKQMQSSITEILKYSKCI